MAPVETAAAGGGGGSTEAIGFDQRPEAILEAIPGATPAAAAAAVTAAAPNQRGGGQRGGSPEMQAISQQMRAIYSTLGLDPRTAGQCLRRQQGANSPAQTSAVVPVRLAVSLKVVTNRAVLARDKACGRATR